VATSSWGSRALVSTSSPLAVQAGLWALGEGGTAVDAAVAADAVLGVIQPMWTGIGGDAFCLVDDGREVAGLNGSGASPAALTLAAAQEAAERRDGGRAHEFQRGLTGDSPLTVTVPGVVDAWQQLCARYGRLGLAQVLEPARRLARRGFPVGTIAARRWSESSGRLGDRSRLPRTVRPGERVANPELADSLDAVAAGGAAAHYGGSFAEAAVAAVTEAGGVLAADDLAGHAGEWVRPLSGPYRDVEVVQMPPNGQGASVLAALARRDREPVGSPEDPETWVAKVAAVRDGMRQALAHVADPRLVDVPPFWARNETVYTAVYADGMAVSLISSVFEEFGSGIAAGGAVLQDRGSGFCLDPSHPNAVAGAKRPFHTIIPALLRREGSTWAVLGVVGGFMQPQGQLQVISHLVDHGADPQRALDEPRAAWLGGDLVGLEAGVGGDVADALGAAGFRVLERPVPPDMMGAGQVVRVHADGWLEGGADPRRDGVAFGF
jgi:gamma-glutamyltranspeptidase/glutathione hydrolase